MQLSTQRRDPSVFLQVWNLYQTCRKSGTWGKLVLETEDGEEMFTFSSKRTSTKPSVNPPPTTSCPQKRRKSPSKWRKDNAKWRLWLEKKLDETKKPCSQEEIPSTPKDNSVLPPVPGYAPTCTPAELVSADIQPSSTLHSPTHTGLSLEDFDYTTIDQPLDLITRTPGGTSLAVLQPVQPVPDGEGEGGVYEDAARLPGSQHCTEMETETTTEPRVTAWCFCENWWRSCIDCVETDNRIDGCVWPFERGIQIPVECFNEIHPNHLHWAQESCYEADSSTNI